MATLKLDLLASQNIKIGLAESSDLSYCTFFSPVSLRDWFSNERRGVSCLTAGEVFSRTNRMSVGRPPFWHPDPRSVSSPFLYWGGGFLLPLISDFACTNHFVTQVFFLSFFFTVCVSYGCVLLWIPTILCGLRTPVNPLPTKEFPHPRGSPRGFFFYFVRIAPFFRGFLLSRFGLPSLPSQGLAIRTVRTYREILPFSFLSVAWSVALTVRNTVEFLGPRVFVPLFPTGNRLLFGGPLRQLCQAFPPPQIAFNPPSTNRPLLLYEAFHAQPRSITIRVLPFTL